MQLIIITPEVTATGETKSINHFFENGLLRLHLRKSLFSIAQYRDYLIEIDSKYHPRISIHGSFKLFDEFKLGGVHLNSSSRNDANTWQQIKEVAPSSVSTSFHSWKEVQDNVFSYGYVFISPVFDSISKTNYKAGIDLSVAREVKQSFISQNRYCPSIVGLGGVGIKQIETLHRYGFDGVAMLGAIWQSENPEYTFIKAMEMIYSLSDG